MVAAASAATCTVFERVHATHARTLALGQCQALVATFLSRIRHPGTAEDSPGGRPEQLVNRGAYQVPSSQRPVAALDPGEDPPCLRKRVVAQLLGTGAQPAHDDLDVIRVCLGDEQVFEVLDVGGCGGEPLLSAAGEDRSADALLG